MHNFSQQLFQVRHVLIRVLLCLSIVILLTGCSYKNNVKPLIDQDELFTLYSPRDDGKPLSAAELQAFNSTGDLDKNLSQKEKEIVELHFKYFVHENRATFERFLTRSARFLPYTQKTFKERGLPQDLAYLFMVESGGNPKAISPAGAAGLWQFMPYTGKKYGLKQNRWLDERRDPFKATFAASDYLLKLYGDFKDWHLAAAAYNAGEGKIGRALEGTKAVDFFELCNKDCQLTQTAQLKDETRQYVPRLLAVAKIMRNLKKLGFREPSPQEAYVLNAVTIPPGINLKAFSTSLGLNWEEFSTINPAFRRNVSPPTTACTAYVPPLKLLAAQSWLASGQGRMYADWKEYIVKKRDTLASISKKHKVSLASLKEANDINSTPKPGSVLLIPASVPVRTAAKTGGPLPAGASYRVQAGDSLFSLAQSWGVSVDQIKQANQLKNNTVIIGQTIAVPGKSRFLAQKKNNAKLAAQRNEEKIPPLNAPSFEELPTGVSKQNSMNMLAKNPEVAPPTPVHTNRAQFYTVRKGDTLYSIARKHNLTVKELCTINKLDASKPVRLGRKLAIHDLGAAQRVVASAKVPAIRTGAGQSVAQKSLKLSTASVPRRNSAVTVQQGDTLFSIAKKHKTSVAALRKANNLTAMNNHLRLGQRLIIPQ